jgi:hypothetical protein
MVGRIALDQAVSDREKKDNAKSREKDEERSAYGIMLKSQKENKDGKDRNPGIKG